MTNFFPSTCTYCIQYTLSQLYLQKKEPKEEGETSAEDGEKDSAEEGGVKSEEDDKKEKQKAAKKKGKKPAKKQQCEYQFCLCTRIILDSNKRVLTTSKRKMLIKESLN